MKSGEWSLSSYHIGLCVSVVRSDVSRKFRNLKLLYEVSRQNITNASYMRLNWSPERKGQELWKVSMSMNQLGFYCLLVDF
jgi:hypothetical protein